MFAFFSITKLLINQIRESLEAILNASSAITGAVALVFCVVLVLNVFNSKINKKFFVNNKRFIFITLVLEAISCLISSDETLIKFNFFTIIVSLLIVLYKVTSAKKTPQKKEQKNERTI